MPSHECKHPEGPRFDMPGTPAPSLQCRCGEVVDVTGESALQMMEEMRFSPLTSAFNEFMRANLDHLERMNA